MQSGAFNRIVLTWSCFGSVWFTLRAYFSDRTTPVRAYDIVRP